MCVQGLEWCELLRVATPPGNETHVGRVAPAVVAKGRDVGARVGPAGDVGAVRVDAGSDNVALLRKVQGSPDDFARRDDDGRSGCGPEVGADEGNRSAVGCGDAKDLDGGADKVENGEDEVGQFESGGERVSVPTADVGRPDDKGPDCGRQRVSGARSTATQDWNSLAEQKAITRTTGLRFVLRVEEGRKRCNAYGGGGASGLCRCMTQLSLPLSLHAVESSVAERKRRDDVQLSTDDLHLTTSTTRASSRAELTRLATAPVCCFPAPHGVQ